ncbi:MAG: 23S rRNA methyltransferase [Gammaproteobacteria bacterium RIFCSPLOWO2_02_47_7]|nr:MAG: 23S rRNA methyltransferase [Gammaproteobacteria bacterium RIFCSPLOWO2_01_FULL_47_190]OGT66349.1 MAG: 23S rRNA methyltransferase [Gammaproteobacteria bacterium RIFCSPLOWO2_02_47_7]OGT72880.1 MAG: 23S rRNA methyltransferase [Gammaproteobacteria bacterium RIFCSPLOWO2_12_47_11]OGT86916.1 MAG: 23S rRNA methyltransferase [Gammaproteobacteria bacterium RIFCSPLOWO2_12_FULL_47_76]
MSKRPSSTRWLQRQKKDPYVKQAQQSEYRSRAVYKLKEIDEKDHLFRKGQTVIDLGAAPGSWSQYVARQVGPQGKVIAIDILPLDSIDNVLFIKGDFTEQAIYKQCLYSLDGQNADLVISDMAPNISGIKSSDQARSMHLAETARDLACQVLRPGGDVLIKIFEGEGVTEFRQGLKEHFRQILTRKPRASRDSSREFYILARTFRC